MVLLQVWDIDSPAGRSNSSRQSDIGTELKLVMVNRAMKPVCHVESTDNRAVAAAASATGMTGSPTAAISNTDATSRSVARQRFTPVLTPATAANPKSGPGTIAAHAAGGRPYLCPTETVV